MATLERPIDRGTRLGRAGLTRVGRELREARQDRGLSLAVVAKATGLSASQVSRIERGLVPTVPLLTLARLCAVVGLDLVPQVYPGGRPVRDAPQIALLAEFRVDLHPSIGWATEVPVPIRGDQRSWDGVVTGRIVRDRAPGATRNLVVAATHQWRYGVEAETLPRDAQALNRRIQLKIRDSGFDGAFLLLPDTRRVREFLRAAQPELAPNFPVDGRRAMDLLRAGVDPGGNAIICLRRRPR